MRFLLALLAAPALGCVTPAPEFETRIDRAAIDQALFDRAVRWASSAARCERGLGALAGDPALAEAAVEHSEDMAATGIFAHESPKTGGLQDRLAATPAQYGTAAENLALYPLLDLAGETFFVRDAAACVFARTWTGPPIPPHSYRSLAEAMVEGWLNSPPHRRNLLDPGLSRHGAGLGIGPGEDGCGEAYGTQVFAD